MANEDRGTPLPEGTKLGMTLDELFRWLLTSHTPTAVASALERVCEQMANEAAMEGDMNQQILYGIASGAFQRVAQQTK